MMPSRIRSACIVVFFLDRIVWFWITDSLRVTKMWCSSAEAFTMAYMGAACDSTHEQQGLLTGSQPLAKQAKASKAFKASLLFMWVVHKSVVTRCVQWGGCQKDAIYNLVDPQGTAQCRFWKRKCSNLLPEWPMGHMGHMGLCSDWGTDFTVHAKALKLGAWA